jgi:pimeloyl-ACP methyl ester carboxylesterase
LFFRFLKEEYKMLADLVEVKTVDGMTLGGAYFAPSDVERSSSVDAVCFFHGDGGHFYRPLSLELGQRLAEQGIAFLAANRRGHDIVAAGARGGPPKGYAFESVDESRLDYAAWLELLRDRGHGRIVIGGHSGGAVRSVYAQAKEQFEDVVAVIPVSPGEYDHKGLIELHPQEFLKVYNDASHEVAEGRPDTFFTPGMPWGSTWSAGAFVDCFNTDNRYSVTSRASEVECPVMFIFGSEECSGPQILPACGAAMRSVKAAEFPHVSVEVIDGANHGYQGRELQLFETIHGWLKTI